MTDIPSNNRIFLLDALLARVSFWRALGDRIVFTNGCFDVLHPGHLYLLAGCAALGDRVIVGLNADASVKRLKGPQRPINGQQARAQLLASLVYTDAVSIFDEDTPEEMIKAVRPDVLVKGGDWQPQQIAGAAFVASTGGRVLTIPFLEGFSSSSIIQQFRQ